MFYILLRPFSFLFIKHDELRRAMINGSLYLSIFATIVIFSVPVTPIIFGKDGFISAISSVFNALPGFFIAALAAVATFNRPELDQVMPDPAPQLKLMTQGRRDFVKLTTRMFLSFLFAYLTAITFLGMAFFIFVEIMRPSALYILSERPILKFPLKIFITFFVNVFIFNIVITTLVGIYFLAERIHRGKV